MSIPRAILWTAFLDALTFGMVLPVLPSAVARHVDDPEAVAPVFGAFLAAGAVAGFIAAPVLGDFSDHFGRRAVLRTSIACAAIDLLLMACAPTLTLVFAGHVLAGLTGATLAVAHAAIADVSDAASRPGYFSRLAAAVAAGIVVGPGPGGALARLDPSMPFLAAVGISLVNLSLAFRAMPETLPPGARRPLDPARWHPLASLRPLWRPTPRARPLRVVLLVCLAGRASSSTWALLTERRFGWTAAEIGISFATMGLATVLAQGVVSPALERRLGLEHTVGLALLWSAATAAGIAGPLLSARMSRAVPTSARSSARSSTPLP